MTKKRSNVRLRLYVAGESPYSLRALANLKTFCREHLPVGYGIEIIDVLETPEHALADHVQITPQLVVMGPESARIVVGDLSDLHSLRDAVKTASCDT